MPLFLPFKTEKIAYRLDIPTGSKRFPALLGIPGASGVGAIYDFEIEVLKKTHVCMSIDHVGYGDSTGKATEQTLQSRLEQALEALLFLVEHSQVDPHNITVYGSSMGGHSASRLLNTGLIANLILYAPASYATSVEEIPMVPGWLGWNKEEMDWPWTPSHAFDAIDRFTGRMLLIQSERDEIIPEKIIQEYITRATRVKEKFHTILKNAPHRIAGFPELKQELLSVVSTFLRTS